jgi:hypothetical protein
MSGDAPNDEKHVPITLDDPIVRRANIWTRYVLPGVGIFVLMLFAIWVWENTPLSQWMRTANARSGQDADGAVASREAAKTTLDVKQSERDANRLRLKQLGDDAADVVRKLDQLDTQRTAWVQSSAALLDDDRGKRIAAQVGPVLAYVQLTSPGALPDVNVEALRSHVELVRDACASRTADKEFTAAPAEELHETVASVGRIATQHLDRFREANLELEALVESTSQAPLHEQPRTLREAVRDLEIQKRQQELAAFAAAAESARQEMEARILATAEASAKKREEDRAQFYEEQLAQLREHERELLKLQLGREAVDQDAARQAVEDETKKKELDNQAKSDKSAQDRQRQLDEQNHQKLVAKAYSAEIQDALAPLLAKGLWQPGQAKAVSRDAVPFSLKAIQAKGALDPTPEGLAKLYELVSSPDNDRAPKWSDATRRKAGETEKWLAKQPASVAAARKAQDALIELGEVLVDLKALAP